jgi:nucleoside-diphosphate-sugar epimerase
MLNGEKILITGVTGQIAFPMAEYLARQNDVWGIARFGDPAARQRVDDIGVTTRPCDLATSDFDGIPDDFTCLLHLAAYQGSETDFDYAITVNAEAAGMLMQHCSKAKAALIMSTSSVYRPVDDPQHAFVETDPVGGGASPWAPTYAVSKIAEEAVVRRNARDTVLADEAVRARWDPCPYSPIFQGDINEQVEALLDAASVPATIVNWGGDEVVSIQEWTAYLGELTGRRAEVVVAEVPGSHKGMISDPTKRLGLTGPCKVGWRDGLRRTVEARTR